MTKDDFLAYIKLMYGIEAANHFMKNRISIGIRKAIVLDFKKEHVSTFYYVDKMNENSISMSDRFNNKIMTYDAFLELLEEDNTTLIFK